MNSSLEITEEQYLIKLSKEDFDISFIHQLLKRIQSEQLFFNLLIKEDTGDLISRKADAPSCNRFDDLRDK